MGWAMAGPRATATTAYEARRPGAGMTTRTLGSSQRGEAEAVWRSLDDDGRPSITTSWTWTETWLRHFGDVVPHRFVVGDVDGRPAGIALVTRQAERNRLLAPTLHVGTAGEPRGAGVCVERNRLHARAAQHAAFGAALAAHLAADRSWARLSLPGFVEEDADALLRGLPGARRAVDESPVADLRPDAGGDVLDALPARRRRRLRQTLQHFGPLRPSWAQTPAEGHAILDELIALHAARWAHEGERGAFSSPRFTAFHRELVDRLVPQGRAALFRVDRGGETVGCLYGFVEGRRLLFYQSGLRRYDDNRLRAGLATHVLFMRACRERGLEEYDFLAGPTRYKLELATRCERLVWATLERPTLHLRVERLARRGRALARRWR